MKITSEKYRIASFVLLIVMGFSVILPATVTAAAFFCNTQLNSVEQVISFSGCNDECIENSQIEITDLSSDDNIAEFCTFQQVCKQTISDPYTKLDSIIPVENKSNTLPTVATTFNTYQHTDTTRNKINHSLLEATFPYLAPPIFLVNSTFLN